MKKITTLFILIGILMPLSGCVERRLTIITQPSDAVVWLNDEELGTSPVTTGFNWYGDYKIRIEKSGYEILDTHRVLPRPGYDYFPLDFFAEVLWPGTIQDETIWNFTLTEAKPMPTETLIQQAESFRGNMQKELNDARGEIREAINK